jgi:hypothetical protein
VREIEKQKGTKPFDVLENSQIFVTQYGVAHQVIKDDRATPEVELSPDFKNQLKTWNNWRIKQSITLSKKKINFSVFSLGEDPRKIAPTDYPKAIKTTADPKIPINQLVHTPNE